MAADPVEVSPSPPGVPGAVEDPSALTATWRELEGHGGDPVRAYLARPRAASQPPGLVIVHHAPGVDDHIQDVANRFAAAGYAVIVPDLFTREGSAPDPADLEALIARLSSLPDERVLGDLEAAISFLLAEVKTNGKVGAIGFCMGGRYALLLACKSDRLAAAVDCWGGFVDRATPDQLTTPNRPQVPLDLLPSLRCPLYAAFGEEDDNPSPAVAERMEKLLQDVEKETTVRRFPGCGHAFFNDRRPSYRPAAAHALWEDVTAFLRRHLAGGQR